MKILFVSTNTNPLATPFNGDGQRTRLLYEACARIADIDIISFEKQKVAERRPGRLRKWIAVLPFVRASSLFPIEKEWEAVVDEAIRNNHYDYIVCRYYYRAMSCGLLKYRDRLVLDFDDDLSFYFLNQISSSKALTTRIRLRLAASKAKYISKHTVNCIHTSFFANERMANDYKAVFLPNIPFFADSCPDVDLETDKHRLLFVGQLEYKPNKEGLDFFLNKIYLPLVQRLPKVEMHIVGKISNEDLRQFWQSYPNVTVTGFVDDLRQEYNQSHVVVIPIHQCGATNIKLLEAMAMNRACVVTKEVFDSFQGHFIDKRDLYVANNPDSFIESIHTLLTDSVENLRIAHNAKKAMDIYYSFDAFAEIVKTAIG